MRPDHIEEQEAIVVEPEKPDLSRRDLTDLPTVEEDLELARTAIRIFVTAYVEGSENDRTDALAFAKHAHTSLALSATMRKK